MYQNPYHSFWKNLLSSKVTMVSLLVIFLFVSHSIYKEKKSQQETLSNISQLESEIAELENNNLELAEMIKYLKSDRFVEFEAREKLGYQKPDEKVVIIPEAEPKIAGAGTRAETIIPNHVKWFKYFFE